MDLFPNTPWFLSRTLTLRRSKCKPLGKANRALSCHLQPAFPYSACAPLRRCGLYSLCLECPSFLPTSRVNSNVTSLGMLLLKSQPEGVCAPCSAMAKHQERTSVGRHHTTPRSCPCSRLICTLACYMLRYNE